MKIMFGDFSNKTTMEILIKTINGKQIANIVSEEIIINNVEDSVDVLGNCSYRGASGIIIQKKNLSNDFFELRTGIAGEILQKFSNYAMRLAIVGDFANIESKSLRDFIRESNRVGCVNFADSNEEAEKKLSL